MTRNIPPVVVRVSRGMLLFLAVCGFVSILVAIHRFATHQLLNSWVLLIVGLVLLGGALTFFVHIVRTRDIHGHRR